MAMIFGSLALIEYSVARGLLMLVTAAVPLLVGVHLLGNLTGAVEGARAISIQPLPRGRRAWPVWVWRFVGLVICIEGLSFHAAGVHALTA